MRIWTALRGLCSGHPAICAQVAREVCVAVSKPVGVCCPGGAGKALIEAKSKISGFAENGQGPKFR